MHIPSYQQSVTFYQDSEAVMKQVHCEKVSGTQRLKVTVLHVVVCFYDHAWKFSFGLLLLINFEMNSNVLYSCKTASTKGPRQCFVIPEQNRLWLSVITVLHFQLETQYLFLKKRKLFKLLLTVLGTTFGT